MCDDRVYLVSSDVFMCSSWIKKTDRRVGYDTLLMRCATKLLLTEPSAIDDAKPCSVCCPSCKLFDILNKLPFLL
jgi:hypothetical protein